MQWDTPFQTPPFSQLEAHHYVPAVRQALAQAAAATDAIAANPEPPTFDNTVTRLEASQLLLDRTMALLLNLNECCTTPALHEAVMTLLPEVTRHDNALWMNARLYERVRQMRDHPDPDLTAEQRQLLERYHQRFVRNGVALPPEAQQHFAANAEELSTLSEQFNHNALDDTNSFHLHLTDAALLAGLPATALEAARSEAARRGLDGWVVTLQAPSYRPFMAYADNRELRRQLWQAFNSRGNRGGATDNNAIVSRITALRLEQARLLGYADYASYSLERTMAHDVATVSAFLGRLHDACRPHAEVDLDEVRALARSCGADYELQSWDFAYWSERLKRQRYDFDAEALRPFLAYKQVRHGIFDLYRRLYGLTFTQRTDIEVYHPDVEVFEVRDAGGLLGILYLDMFARPSKRSGAWMTEFREQRNLDGNDVRPLVQVVCNFSQPIDAQPSLLSTDELRTFMHEMGHAVHALLSQVHYPSLSGTNVWRDFVEMPSQLMENWCDEPAFLHTFALHYQTGQPLPDSAIDKMRRSRNFQAGWLCLRQLNFGMLDMAYHTLTQPLAEPAEAFEARHTDALLPHSDGASLSTAFTHIFSGGYAAGYYGYKWAEVLDADIFARFKADGLYNADTAAQLRHHILERGGSEPPAVLFRRFMGRDPDPDALMRRCGFVDATTT